MTIDGIYDEINRLPDSWQRIRLGEVLNVIRGASPRPKGDPKYFGGKIPWIMISDITREPGKFISQTKDHVTEEGAKKSRYLKPGTLILSNSGTVCVPKILSVAGCIHDGFIAFPELPDTFDQLFLYYYFDFIRPKIINAHRQGITQVNLNTTIVKDIRLIVPPINEQKRIVAEIEKQFSRLDEAVENLQRVKANLKRYKASVLKAAVEGKLTEQWRAEHPDVEPASQILERILKERRKKWEENELARMKAKGQAPKDDKWKKKYKEPELPKLEQVPTVPNCWCLAGIDQLLPPERDAMKTGPFGSLLKKHEHKASGVPVLGIENISSMKFVKGSKIHISKEKAKELGGYKVIPGDIIISRSGTVGEICVVPDGLGDARISTNIMKLSLMRNGLLPDFFTFLFNGSPFILGQIHELCKGSTRNFLNQDILRHIVFVIPPREEQQQIIKEVDKAFSLIDELEIDIEHDLKRADRLRQSILKTAFSGRLVPSSQGYDTDSADDLPLAAEQSTEYGVQN